MNYETTKRTMMDAYPSLFTCEADVLHHLFFVIGNGYEWVDGELSDGCEQGRRCGSQPFVPVRPGGSGQGRSPSGRGCAQDRQHALLGHTDAGLRWQDRDDP